MVPEAHDFTACLNLEQSIFFQVENKSEPYISVIYQLPVLVIGSPMPARAIKLLKDPRWRATLLHTPLAQAGKKACFLSELLTGGAAQLHTGPGRGLGRERAGPGGRGQQGRAAESPERSLGDT